MIKGIRVEIDSTYPLNDDYVRTKLQPRVGSIMCFSKKASRQAAGRSSRLSLSLSLCLFLCFSGCSSNVQQQLEADHYVKKGSNFCSRLPLSRSPSHDYQKAWDIYKTDDNPQIQTAILYNIGHVYYNLQEYENALKYYKLSIQSFSSLEKETRINILNNVGVIYRYLGRYDDALKYFDTALKLSKRLGRTRQMILRKQRS